MWKKLMITMVCFFGMFSIAYLNHNTIQANTASVYSAGGSVSGRVMQPPLGLITTGDSNLEIRIGDLIQMNTYNEYAGKPLVFQLLAQSTYTDHWTEDSCTPTIETICNNESITAWFAISDDAIDHINPGFQTSQFKPSGAGGSAPLYTDSFMHSIMNEFSTKLNANASDKSYLAPRNLQTAHEKYANYKALNNLNNMMILKNSMSDIEELKDNIFTPHTLDPKLIAEGSNSYWTNTTYHGGGSASSAYYSTYTINTTSGKVEYIKNAALASSNIEADLRPAAYISQNKLNQIVFAVSRGTSDDWANIDPNVNEPLRPRVFDSSLNVSLDALTASKNIDADAITEISENQRVYLKASANSIDGSIISVLIFDENGTFIRYKPLEAARGEGFYTLDLTGLTTGKYQIAVVNEIYNDSINGETKASYLSNTKTIEIVPALSDLTYTANLGEDSNELEHVYQATDQGEYATSQESEIGVISSKNGAGSATNDIKYSVIEASDSAHSGDEAHFKVAMNETTGKPLFNKDQKVYTLPNLSLNESFLSPGVYKYRIQAYDDTGAPYKVDSADDSITYPIDKNGNAIQSNISVNKGLITDDISTIIYPSPAMLEVKVLKHDNNTADNVTDDHFFGKSEIDEATVLAELRFKEDANLQALSEEGYHISSLILKEKGTNNVIENFYLEDDPNDINSYMLKWNSLTSLLTGKIEFDLYITFEHNDLACASIIKENLSITIDNDFDVTKIKWQNKTTIPDAFTDIEGVINKNGINTATLSLHFQENSSFYTQISNIEDVEELKGATITYSLKEKSTENVIDVADNGKITVIGISPENADVKIQAKITKENYKDAYVYLPVMIQPGLSSFSFVDENGDQLSMEGDSYIPYQKDGKNLVFSKTDKFQLYTGGQPTGSKVSYKLKDTSPTDVIEVNQDTGEVTILNATMPIQKDKVVVIATAIDPTGNYADMSIEIAINIDQAPQTIEFKESSINVLNGKGSISPQIVTMDISSNLGGVEIKDTNYIITIDNSVDSSIAWTSDGKEINYEYTEDEGIDITFHASKQGNRNYKASATISGNLHILGKAEATLELSNVGKITYGDHFCIQSLQDDSMSQNVKYDFKVSDDSIIIQNDEILDDGIGEFDAIKSSVNKELEISVTRMADGELPLSKLVKIKVLPKNISITVDAKEKLRGEENPAFTYQAFQDQLISWDGIKDVIQSGDVKLSTTATINSDAGGYPITGDTAYLNKTYQNYNFTFTNGTLSVKEETVKDEWYHMETKDGNRYTGSWTNQAVGIISDHDDYINLSLDQSTWAPNKVTVSKEGNNETSFWMKKDNGAITGEKKETIKIDQKAPSIENITANDTNNTLQDIIYKLSGGIFFQPGTTFEITTSDKNEDLEVSGSKTISYKLYKKENGTYGSPMNTDTITVNQEKTSIRIADTVGTYQLCMTVTDQAGNASDEVCKEMTLKKLNLDVDGDGTDDFIDSDGDGCPDLDIVLGKDEQGDWIKLNVDIDHDGAPDLNIDVNGDGRPDINIDQDEDGIPDLNIVKVTEWNPSICVTSQIEEYCTDGTLVPNINVDLDQDGRPDINIDLDDTEGGHGPDGIPDIDIDTDGDGKPEINIDSNKDGTADQNIKKLTDWTIDKDIFTVNGVKFQTMTGLTPDTINRIEDNGVIAEPGDGMVFLPNYALKVDDVTEAQKVQVASEAAELLKESQEVKTVYDVKLMKDHVETQPDGTLKIKIPVPAGIKNPILLVKNEDGVYQKLSATYEDGYLIYETDMLGIVSVIGDIETSGEPTPNQEEKPQTSVKGNYSYTGNIGGANTGDETNVSAYTISIGIAALFFILLYHKKKRSDHNRKIHFNK